VNAIYAVIVCAKSVHIYIVTKVYSRETTFVSLQCSEPQYGIELHLYIIITLYFFMLTAFIFI